MFWCRAKSLTVNCSVGSYVIASYSKMSAHVGYVFLGWLMDLYKSLTLCSCSVSLILWSCHCTVSLECLTLCSRSMSLILWSCHCTVSIECLTLCSCSVSLILWSCHCTVSLECLTLCSHSVNLILRSCHCTVGLECLGSRLGH